MFVVLGVFEVVVKDSVSTLKQNPQGHNYHPCMMDSQFARGLQHLTVNQRVLGSSLPWLLLGVFQVTDEEAKTSLA